MHVRTARVASKTIDDLHAARSEEADECDTAPEKPIHKMALRRDLRQED